MNQSGKRDAVQQISKQIEKSFRLAWTIPYLELMHYDEASTHPVASMLAEGDTLSEDGYGVFIISVQLSNQV